MTIDSAGIARAATAALAAMREAEQELNAADARLGDGDTGVTMRRVFEKVEEAACGTHADLGATFRAMGIAASGATGSSLGTLVALALLEAGKGLQGRNEMPLSDLPWLLRIAQEKMMSRGGAALGDKTVLDSLDAVAAALEAEPPQPGRAAAVAAEAALMTFRKRQCRMGRARMYGERSAGVDDPGMLAFSRLVAAIAEP